MAPFLIKYILITYEILVFVLCIENFAAIVSDNDGSVFLTCNLFNIYYTSIVAYNHIK